MFNWFASFFDNNLLYGPGRNAPGNIRQLLEQKPVQVILVSKQEIDNQRKQLKPTIINEHPPLSNKPAIMCELDNVFENGYSNYFEKLRQRKEKKEEKVLKNEILEDNIFDDDVFEIETIDETMLMVN